MDSENLQSNQLDHAFFYRSVNGDRRYGADSFEHWLKKFFTTGVFAGDLQVMANNSMDITLKSGYANVDGKVRFFENDQVLTLETANATYDRIDNIVIERTDVERDVIAKVVTGGYSSVPAAKEPVRSNGIYQLIVGRIYVRAGAVRITQEDITDTRTDLKICGIVTGTVTQYDFSQFKAQFEGYFANYKQDVQDAYESYLQEIAEQQTVFETWFESMQGKLDEDAAGHLQNQINAMKYFYVIEKTLYIPQTSVSVSGGILMLGTTELEEENGTGES